MQHRIALLLIVAIAGASPLFACAPAPHAGEMVDVVEEAAVIVWDPATKMQHFIRRATFQGNARDFGFLVPTPTAPTLAAVDDEIFETLQEKTKREVIERTRKEIDWSFFTEEKEGMATTAAGAVEVVQAAKVAGYDAVVLDASDAKALVEWLQQHDYATTPELEAWLDAYIRQRWMITAFKIDKSQSDSARTEAVKMSFTTERPFFPYREPPSSNSNRVLRIFFLGPERVAGTIGTAFWAGIPLWSNTIDEDFRAKIARVAGVAIPARLSAFIDIGSRSAVDDLFFARAADQRPYVQPPQIIEHVDRVLIPLDLIIPAALILLIVGFLLRRAFFPH
ncbi:MAG TPA: DUF2330 domain-containing protein [Thermoanaerobaculia bacterium]|nr:DUF2330 domain-containing protein [Thermoanaerobaculia bacterium]